MKLYTGTVEQFNQDVLRNEMPDKLQKAYEQYYYRMANPGEVKILPSQLVGVGGIGVCPCQGRIHIYRY